MRRNLGTLDRLVRFAVGVLLLGLYGALNPPLRYFSLLGLLPLGTALTGNCPLYTLLGVSTFRKDSTKPLT